MFIAAALLLAAGAVFAQPRAADTDASGYPSRPVRIIATNPPGGAADLVGRILAQKLGEALKQQFVFDNRPGAGGIIATMAVVKAAPDGYTLLIVGSTFGVNPGLRPDLPYDSFRDLAAVTMPTNAPNILVVHPSLPVRTVKDLIGLARAKPGQLNYGSPGSGSSPHLGGELLKNTTGIAMTHVPYKGAGPMMIDLIAGQVQLSFASMASAIVHVRAGKARGVATTGARRALVMPELPTMIENGLPGFEVGSWQGIFAPAGTPPGIVGKLHQEIARAIRMPDVKARLATDGNEPVASTPEEFSRWLRVEIARWEKVVKAIGLRVD
jgi:tripartite-type tricarboxylate transporter receptor subunit TctC